MSNRIKLLVPFLSIFVLTFSGCFIGEKGSGVAKTEMRQVNDFTAISASGTADVKVTVGGEKSVKVTIDDNLIEKVKTEVSGGTLKIYTTGAYITSIGLDVEVTVPSLESIQVSGSADLTATNISAKDFEVSISGTGDAEISGSVENLEVSVSGTADASLSNLKAKNVTVSASGTGDAKVYASQSIDASASGTADIEIHGSPSQVKESASGVADIEFVGGEN